MSPSERGLAIGDAEIVATLLPPRVERRRVDIAVRVAGHWLLLSRWAEIGATGW